MNWAECSKLVEGAGGQSRFEWPANGWAGFNCEDGITLSDITGGIAWLWNFPGDALFRHPGVGAFLELDPHHTGGWLSGSVMTLCLIAAFLLIGALADKVAG